MRTLILILIFFSVLSSCTNNKVTTTTNISASATFDNLETWNWRAWEQDGSVNEILQDHIKTKIEQELKHKGMTLKPEGEIDFLVNYIVNIHDDIEVEKLPTYKGYSENYIGLDAYGRHVNVMEFQLKRQADEEKAIKRITKGTLIIDILNPTNNKILMRMVAEKPLPDQKLETSERRELIDSVVKDLLSNFPPEKS